MYSFLPLGSTHLHKESFMNYTIYCNQVKDIQKPQGVQIWIQIPQKKNAIASSTDPMKFHWFEVQFTLQFPFENDLWISHLDSFYNRTLIEYPIECHKRQFQEDEVFIKMKIGIRPLSSNYRIQIYYDFPTPHTHFTISGWKFYASCPPPDPPLIDFPPMPYYYSLHHTSSLSHFEKLLYREKEQFIHWDWSLDHILQSLQDMSASIASQKKQKIKEEEEKEKEVVAKENKIIGPLYTSYEYIYQQFKKIPQTFLSTPSTLDAKVWSNQQKDWLGNEIPFALRMQNQELIEQSQYDSFIFSKMSFPKIHYDTLNPYFEKMVHTTLPQSVSHFTENWTDKIQQRSIPLAFPHGMDLADLDDPFYIFSFVLPPRTVQPSLRFAQVEQWLYRWLHLIYPWIHYHISIPTEYLEESHPDQIFWLEWYQKITNYPYNPVIRLQTYTAPKDKNVFQWKDQAWGKDFEQLYQDWKDQKIPYKKFCWIPLPTFSYPTLSYGQNIHTWLKKHIYIVPTLVRLEDSMEIQWAKGDVCMIVPNNMLPRWKNMWEKLVKEKRQTQMRERYLEFIRKQSPQLSIEPNDAKVSYKMEDLIWILDKSGYELLTV